MERKQSKLFQLTRILMVSLVFLIGGAGSVAENGDSNGPPSGRAPAVTVVPIIQPVGQTLGPQDAAKMGAIAPPELTQRWHDAIERYDPDYTINVAYIKNGELTTRHPSVGVLLEATTPGQYYAVCTGILVDSETFLTAGHCVPNRNNDSVSYAVYLQRVGIIPVGSGGVTTFCDDHDC